MILDDRNRRSATGLFLAGLSWALAGQYVLSHRREIWQAGAAGLAFGAICLAAAACVTSSRALAALARCWAWLQSRRATVIAVLAAGGLVIWADHLAYRRESPYALSLWILGIALGAVALTGVSPRRARAPARQTELLDLTILIGAALALRLVGLAEVPSPMSGDEGSMALEAAKLLRGEWISPFGTGWFSHPNLYFYLLAGSLRAFGWSLFALRLPSALLSALGVGAIYLLARGLFGRPTAWVSALFIAGWSLALHMGRLALNNSADPFFAALVVASLHRGLVHGQRSAFVIAGLLLGLSLYFYFATRLLVPLVIILALLAGRQRLAHHRQGLAALVLAALLVAGPLLAHYARFPDDFVARAATDGLFQSGALHAEQAATGRSIPALLLTYLGHSAGSFVYTPDRGFFYTDTAPMLQVVSGALFVFGVLLALLHRRQPRYAGLLLWIGLAVAVNGLLVKSAPGYHRYLIAAPAVAVLIGRAGVIVTRLVRRTLRLRPVIERAGAVALAIVLAASGVWYYWGVYIPSARFSDRNTEIADRAARRMAELGPAYRSYFLGLPLMRLGGFNSVRFLAPNARWVDVVDESLEAIDAPTPDEGLFLIALPQRFDALEEMIERCPGGAEETVRARNDQVLFHTYRLEPGSICQLESGVR